MAEPHHLAHWYPTAAYLYVLCLDTLALAWEYLRRHPDYRLDWLHRARRLDAAHRWGCVCWKTRPWMRVTRIRPGCLAMKPWCSSTRMPIRRLTLRPSPSGASPVTSNCCMTARAWR